MKLSRLEPHINQPEDDSNDIESFLAEVRDQQSRVEEVSTEVSLPEEGVGSTADEVKQGFVRLVDFLKLKQPAGPRLSKKDMALRAYQHFADEYKQDAQGITKKQAA